MRGFFFECSLCLKSFLIFFSNYFTWYDFRMTTKVEMFKYFDQFTEKNKILVNQFISRFPFHKNYYNKKSLDFGSGTGCLSFKMAEKVGSITGIEIDPLLSEYSKNKLKEYSKTIQEKVVFENISINQISDASYDLIFSKDVFEHVRDVENIMDEMYRVLKPGGECVIGFGPLWYSPFGDHGILRSSIGFTLPWLHLILGKEVIVRLYNNSSLKGEKKYSKRRIEDLRSYLNFKTGEYFRNLINNSKFEIIWYDENIHENLIINYFRKFFIRGPLSRFFIRNIYCQLKKN